MKNGLIILLCCIRWTAQGKDLPRRRILDAPRDDAACAYLGQGYTRVPGSVTCVKITGHVRVDAQSLWNR